MKTTRDDLWKLLSALEQAGLCVMKDYSCEGPPEQVEANPDSTMVLLHPGLHLDLRNDAGGIEIDYIEVGDKTECGMMAADPYPPEEFLKPIGSITGRSQYLRIEDEDEKGGGA